MTSLTMDALAALVPPCIVVTPQARRMEIMRVFEPLRAYSDSGYHKEGTRCRSRSE